MNDCKINIETLIAVLSKMLDTQVCRVEYKTTQLHGGTVGNVVLLSGIAEISNKNTLPFNVVLKITKKWERYADPDSWRREYDLYASNLGAFFLDSMRWPICYHMEINDGETRLWLEYGGILSKVRDRILPGLFGICRYIPHKRYLYP